jgi:hypothetical protein
MAFAMGEMGMRDLDFWELTPYELHRRLIGWRRKQDGRRLNSLYQAWHSAAFARAKRLPTLTRILKPLKTRKLEGNELEVRKREFEERTKRAGVEQPRECPSRQRSAPLKSKSERLSTS